MLMAAVCWDSDAGNVSEMAYSAILLVLLLIQGCAKSLPSCWETRHALPEEEYRACLKSELTAPPSYVPMQVDRDPSRRPRAGVQVEQERLSKSSRTRGRHAFLTSRRI